MGVVRTDRVPRAQTPRLGPHRVALLYIAFVRAAGGDTDAAASPSAVVDPPAAAVVRGDVTNTVSLQGSIQADPATTVKNTTTGVVGKVRADVGHAVEKGTPLFTVVVTVDRPSRPTRWPRRPSPRRRPSR